MQVAAGIHAPLDGIRGLLVSRHMHALTHPSGVTHPPRPYQLSRCRPGYAIGWQRQLAKLLYSI